MFHVGGARSALFNWAVAQRAGGRFVLRVEDTDAARNRPEWTEGIIRALAWIGIEASDPAFEGPYFQSAYAADHDGAARRLHTSGRAYYCDCTRDQVVERRTAAGSDPQKGYDGFCRDRGLERAPGRALRFRSPDDGVTVVDDRVRGRVEFPNDAMEDFVIARGDGSALFVLANVADDMAMGITEVIRAEEHLSNTPKQQLLWEALGRTPPIWAHLPVIVNEKRQKLSKRRDKVALEDYQAAGYLPDAMVNYLMLLGWSPGGDQEIMPWPEMVAKFRVEDVNQASAFFDEKKLRAFNGEYIRTLTVERFTAACHPWLTAPHAPWRPDQYDPEAFAALAPLAQTRVALLSEITANVDFLFLDEPLTDEKSWEKAMKPGAEKILEGALAEFTTCDWTAETLKAVVERVGTAQGMKLGKAQAPIRVAVTGRTIGLPLFESLEVLGRPRTLPRLESALTNLAS
jgi:glutamyl-tRNA synthetase